MDPAILRAVERLIVVLVGGACVYLGYRLFLRLPDSAEGEGRFSLPGGATAYLTRVGPGVFFALFGAAVVAFSLHASVTYSRETGCEGEEDTAAANEKVYYGGMVAAAESGSSTRPFDSLDLRLEVEFLNDLPSLLRSDLTPAEKRRVQERVDRGKLALMHSVWRPDWGSFDGFRSWVDEGAVGSAPNDLAAAEEYFRAGASGP